MGHPQPATPMHCDNETAAGIVNGTVRRQRSRMFQMRYFYACDQVDKKYFVVHWHPGKENLGDYPSKHHEGAHHKLMRPIYLHEENSPLVLQRALTPREVRALGVGTVAPKAGGRKSQPLAAGTFGLDPRPIGMRGCVGNGVGRVGCQRTLAHYANHSHEAYQLGLPQGWVPAGGRQTDHEPRGPPVLG